MGFIRDAKAYWKGNYLTVDEVAHGFETTEVDARLRLDDLVDGAGVLKEIKDGVYIVAEDASAEELRREFNKKFSDLRKQTSDELDYLETV